VANSNEIGAIFNVLTTNYGYIQRDKKPQELAALLDIWKQTLCDIDGDVLKAATLQHISESQWFPSVAELRKAAAEIVAPNQTTPVEEWGKVKKQIAFPGYVGTPRFDDEITAAVVIDIGWQTICLSEDETSTRARFIQGYTERLKRDRRKAVQLPQVADAIKRVAEARRMPQLKDGKK